LMSNLELFDISNTGISGDISSEIGQLTKLTFLRFFQNELVGSVPTEIGFLTDLESLEISQEDINGTIPIEVSSLTRLTELSLNHTNLSGSIPREIGNLTSLERLQLNNPMITGSIPVSICNQGADVDVNCDRVKCACCGCPLTLAPSPSPSQSTRPTTSLEPSSLPSKSLAPSYEGCQLFSSIAEDGTLLSYQDQRYEGGWTYVDLPFVFQWRGQSDHTHITVTSNGVIWVGITKKAGGCSANPVELGNGYQEDKRIAVAQEWLDASSGSIYVKAVGNAFVVSWEDVHHSKGPARYGLNFQAVLFRDGRVELRWGEGNPPSDRSVAAGIEEDEASVAVPASGGPFDDGGVTAPGTWPTGQCRAFEPDGIGGYVAV